MEKLEIRLNEYKTCFRHGMALGRETDRELVLTIEMLTRELRKIIDLKSDEKLVGVQRYVDLCQSLKNLARNALHDTEARASEKT